VLDTAPEERSGSDGRPTHHTAGPALDLRRHVEVLRRHWWIAALTFLVVLAASLGSLLVTGPVYSAQAEVLLRTQDSQQLFPRTSDTSPGALTRAAGAELAYAGSDEFRDVAAEAAGGDDAVQVSNELGSDVLVFTADGDDAEATAATAQAWADTYVEHRHERDVTETARLRDLLVAERADADARRTELLEPVAALDAAIAREPESGELSSLLNQQLALQRSLAGELNPLEADIRRLDGQIAALDLDLRVLEDPQALAVVTRAAEVPDSRADGSLTRSLVVGVLAGLVLAVAAVTLAERLRRS
jgi:uncharacterized protein involved in exopolysaccharide biosynthesis